MPIIDGKRAASAAIQESNGVFYAGYSWRTAEICYRFIAGGNVGGVFKSATVAGADRNNRLEKARQIEGVNWCR